MIHSIVERDPRCNVSQSFVIAFIDGTKQKPCIINFSGLRLLKNVIFFLLLANWKMDSVLVSANDIVY